MSGDCASAGRGRGTLSVPGSRAPAGYREPMVTVRKRLITAALAALMIVAAAGCGDDDDSPRESDTPGQVGS